MTSFVVVVVVFVVVVVDDDDDNGLGRGAPSHREGAQVPRVPRCETNCDIGGVTGKAASGLRLEGQTAT